MKQSVIMKTTPSKLYNWVFFGSNFKENMDLNTLLELLIFMVLTLLFTGRGNMDYYLRYRAELLSLNKVDRNLWLWNLWDKKKIKFKNKN